MTIADIGEVGLAEAAVQVLPPPASPFLPGTHIQYAWDSTSIGYLKTCPRLYYYHMIEGWVPKGESLHLRFGIEYHTALQDYDNSRALGISHDDAIHDVLRALLTRIEDWEIDPEAKAARTKNKSTLARTVVWYLDHYRDDAATTFIKADGKPAVELSFKFELDWGPQPKMVQMAMGDLIERPSQPYLLCGHLDKVVTFSGALFVMDHKTAGNSLSDYYFQQYEPNNQMTLYTLASQVVLEAPVRGVIVDAVQVHPIDYAGPKDGTMKDFQRRITYRTPDQLEEWTQDLEYWFNLAESYAEANYWPQNDTACNNYGGCRFREVCSKSPTVRPQFLKSSFERTEPWNPLKPR